MLNFWAKTETLLAQKGRLFVAFVVANKKGSPGTPAARMLIDSAGHQWGTIGGGVMEQGVSKVALRAFEEAHRYPQLVTLAHQSGAQDGASGLICGGAQTNLYVMFDHQRDGQSLAQLAALEKSQQAAVISFSARGYDIAEGKTLAQPVEVRHPRADGWEVCIDLRSRRNIAIFGGGHCGVALSRLMVDLQYRVTLFETRAEVCTLAQLPAEVTLYQGENALHLPSLPSPEKHVAVIMTHSYPSDIEALKYALGMPFAFIGVMGSKTKIAKIMDTLQTEGFGKEQLARITAPVGLPLDSDTPEEIAVSIAAQLLQLRDSLNL